MKRILVTALLFALASCAKPQAAPHTMGAAGGYFLPAGASLGTTVYANDAGGWTTLAPGTNGQTMQLASGAPSWGSGGGGGTTLPDGGTGAIWYQASGGVVTALPAGAVGQTMITQGPGAAPIWNNINAGFFGSIVVPPLASSFVQYNAGGRSTSLTTVNNTLLMSLTNGTTGYDARVAMQSVPGATWHMIVHFAVVMQPVTNVLAGVGCRESSNGSIETYEIEMSSTSDELTLHQATANNTSTSPTYSQSSTTSFGNVRSEYVGAGGYWFWYGDDGTNRNFYVSQNGADWSVINQIGDTSFLTCNQYGVEIFSSSSSTGTLSARFDSLAITTP
jgi:hypothetical protein